MTPPGRCLQPAKVYHHAMPIEVQHLTIVHYPRPILRQKAQPIASIDQQVIDVARRMIDLMHEARGVGLAAPQVGLPWRLFVANPTAQPGPDDQVYINPTLSAASREADRMEEGCLSLPDVRGQIMRPISISITATNLAGQSFTQTDHDLLARIWQHEFDHLEGVLIIDKMSPQDLRLNKRAIESLQASGL